MTLRSRLTPMLRLAKRVFAPVGYLALVGSMLIASVGVQQIRELQEESSELAAGAESSEATLEGAHPHRRAIRRLHLVGRRLLRGANDAPRVAVTSAAGSRSFRDGRPFARVGHILANGLRAPLLA